MTSTRYRSVRRLKYPCRIAWLGSSDVAEVILESHEGGRWYERGVDGTECDWGRVLAWEPPTRVLFTWQIGGNWQFDPDPAHASEIEVRFHADGPAQTTVEVEHRYFERLIDGEGVHGAIRSGGGWPALLDSYARMVKDQTSGDQTGADQTGADPA